MHFDWAHWRQLLRKIGSIGSIDPISKARAALPHKSQQVLDLIRSSYPATVSRMQIIDDCWDGNMLVGEKGLNHALWAIRQALGDDARNPIFIRTVSRKGYSWIGSAEQNASDLSSRRLPLIVALVIPLLLAMSAHFYLTDATVNRSNASQLINAPDGQSAAFFRGRDIIVEQKPDVVLVMRPTGRKHFGKPSYSLDSNRLAFPMYNASQCELVVVALDKRTFKKFENCPI